jgi:hypothetical protein
MHVFHITPAQRAAFNTLEGDERFEYLASCGLPVAGLTPLVRDAVADAYASTDAVVAIELVDNTYSSMYTQCLGAGYRRIALSLHSGVRRWVFMQKENKLLAASTNGGH